VDVYIGDWIERDRFLGAWQCVEPILLEDASIGVGVSGGRRGFEVFLDPDKRILIYASPEMAPKVEQLLRRFRLKRCSEDAVRGGPARSELRVRPVLEERPGMLSTVDHLLLELRADWALELDDDPDHNLDSRGRDIGFTLWHGLVFVDQEDPAGRRFGHAHVWGVATSRREMQGIIEARIARDYEWEFRETLNLDRVAFDDRPSELDQMQTPLFESACLCYDVEAIGTGPAQWGEDG